MRREIWGIAVGGLSLLASACIDAGARFDDFHERSLRARARDAGPPDMVDAATDAGTACVPPKAAQLAGRYLVAVSAGVAPDKPILSQLDVEPKDVEGGVDAKLTFRLLAAKDQRTPVGDPTPGKLTLRGTKLEIPKISFAIPGAANSLMEGIEGVVETSFSGTLCVPKDQEVDSFCGDIKGTIVEPLIFELEGSTFGAVRVIAKAPWPMWKGRCDDEAAP